MAPVDIQALSYLIVDPANALRFHTPFLGSRSRHDRWSVRSWRRTDDHHLLFLIQDGEMTIRPDSGRVHACGPGSAVLLSPDLRPDVTFSKSLWYHEVYFTPCRKHSPVRLTPSFLIAERSWELADGIDNLAAEIQLGCDASFPLVRHWMGLLIAQFAGGLEASRSKERTLSAAERTRMLRWFRAHLHHDPSPAELASAAGLSADYFSRIFRATFGLSPRDWIVRERMREASRLLTESDAPVYAVAERMGYESVAHFCRQFRKIIGKTPGSWRRQA